MTSQSIISDQDRAQLKRTLRKDLKGDVELRLFTQKSSPIAIPGRECPGCPQTRQLMEELVELSPRLRLEVHDFYAQPEAAREYGIERIPAIAIGPHQPARVKYYGTPLGYELATLIQDITTLSRGVSPLSMETRKALKQVDQPVHIQVFVTPT
jgi:hypothetical protein